MITLAKVHSPWVLPDVHVLNGFDGRSINFHADSPPPTWIRTVPCLQCPRGHYISLKCPGYFDINASNSVNQNVRVIYTLVQDPAKLSELFLNPRALPINVRTKFISACVASRDYQYWCSTRPVCKEVCKWTGIDGLTGGRGEGLSEAGMTSQEVRTA